MEQEIKQSEERNPEVRETIKNQPIPSRLEYLIRTRNKISEIIKIK